MSTRDVILQRIRTELAKTAPVDPPPVPEVWPRTDPSGEELAECFSSALQAVQGEVVRCGSMEEAKRKLVELAAEAGWDTIGSVDRPALRELTAGIDQPRIAWPGDDWSGQQMGDLAAGLVEAESLLADTGSCLVDCRTAQERLLCYLPPTCVVLARRERLFEHMPAAWDEIGPAVAEPERRGEFVLITGPSRTADIEKILILGVHGPKRLIVLLV